MVLYPQKFSIEGLIISFSAPEHRLHSSAFPAAIVKEEGWRSMPGGARAMVWNHLCIYVFVRSRQPILSSYHSQILNQSVFAIIHTLQG